MKEKHHKKEKVEEKEEPEIKINTKKIKSIKKKFEKTMPRWTTLLLIITLLLFSYYVHMLPKQLSITDSWARNAVYNSIKNNIAANVNKYYPNLPPSQKQEFINSQFEMLLKNKTQLNQINRQIKYVSQEFKKQFEYTSNNQTHVLLGDIDSYYWLRWARNLKDTGHYCDEVVDGRCFDNHMIAPLGTFAVVRPHPFIIFFTYKVASIFDKKIDIMQASYAAMVILCMLVTLFAFLLGKEVAGNIGGFFTSLIITINPFFIMRVSGSDDDVYNFLFPILIAWLTIKTIKSKSNKKAFWTYAGLTAASVAAYSFTWAGWWFTFDMLLGGVAVYGIVRVIMNLKEVRKGFDKETKSLLTAIIIIFLLSWIGVGLVQHSATGFIKSTMISPLQRSATLKEVAKSSGWPNIYNTVAELNAGSFKQIINSIGGSLNFLIALLGIFLLVFIGIKEKKDREINFLLASIIIVWMLGATYATYKGVRFILLFITPFIIAYGAGMGLLFKIIEEQITKIKRVKENKNVKRLISSAVIVFLLLVSLPSVSMGINTSKSYIPNMTTTWYTSLTKIREESAPNAIINSWWDFGHWFKFVANRRVTADGASQNSPQVYWLGKVLVETNETEAVNILRMLDCGSNNAFNVINKKYQNTRESVEIEDKILDMNITEIKNYLSSLGFNNSDINEIINYTKCNPPEDYFITSDDMIGKAGVWAHFGLWSFRKAEALEIAKKEGGSKAIKFMEDKLGYSKAQAVSEYNKILSFQGNSRKEQSWISPWPGYASTRGSCRVNKDAIVCINNLQGQYIQSVFNITSRNAYIETNMGKAEPKEVVVYYDGYEFKKDYENSSINLAWVIFLNGNQIKSVYCSPELAESLFTKLYFGDGYGMKYFKLFSDEGPSPVGTRVAVWNVSWKGLTVKKGSRVTLLYIGYLENGSVFDSTITNWKELNISKNSDFKDYMIEKPFTFTEGAHQVIPGFEKGVEGMKVGEEKVIKVPPEEGYKTGKLAGKTLYFKVRVIKID